MLKSKEVSSLLQDPSNDHAKAAVRRMVSIYRRGDRNSIPREGILFAIRIHMDDCFDAYDLEHGDGDRPAPGIERYRASLEDAYTAVDQATR